MGDAKHGATAGSEGAEQAARRVVVAGDVTMDWNLARTRKAIDSGLAWSAADRTEMYGQPGGAALTARLTTEVAATLAARGVTVEVAPLGAPAEPIAPADTSFHHSYAIWSKFRLDPTEPNVHRGIRSGLAAARALHLAGYGAVDCEAGRAGLAFPACDVAAELAKEPRDFHVAQIPQPASDSWSILPLAWVHAGNRAPGTLEATTLGAKQGTVTFENL